MSGNFLNILDFLTGAPWWAYGILLYLLYLGFKAIQPQTMWVPKLFIFPTIVTSLLLMNLFTQCDFRLDSLAVCMLSWMVGTITSWLIFKNTKITFDQAKNIITLPGGYATLIILISVFVVRYVWGYLEAIHPTPIHIYWVYLKMLSTGMLSGLSVGRSVAYLYKFLQLKHSL